MQLYHYPKNGVSNANKDAPFVYNCWKQKRQPYPSSLYVTVKAIRSVEERDVSRRAVLPTEVEVGKQTYEELMDEYLNRKKTVDPLMKNLINVPTKPVWRRLAGQKCIIPNKIMYKIDSGSGGSQCIAFSNNGVYLAIASISNLNVASGKNSGSNAQNSSYIIKIYTVQTGERVANLEGHQDLIYELNWSHNDRYLSSSSSDGSVRVWTFSIDGSIRSTSIYQHPSYVYTTAFHPTSKSPQVLASGCFDGKIRIWIQDLHNKLQDYKRDTPFLVLTGHESQVNSLCFATDGNRMYSGDSNGVLKIWATDIPHESSKPLTDHIGDFRCLKSISTEVKFN